MAKEATAKETRRGSRARPRKKRTFPASQATTQASSLPRSNSSDSLSSEGRVDGPVPPRKCRVNDEPLVREKAKAIEERVASTSSNSPVSEEVSEEVSSPDSQSSSSPKDAGEVTEAREQSERPAEEPSIEAKPDFEAWYLKAATHEFAADLEKLRQAPDFKDASVPILVDFLKQGASLFSEEEKRIVMEKVGQSCV